MVESSLEITSQPSVQVQYRTSCLRTSSLVTSWLLECSSTFPDSTGLRTTPNDSAGEESICNAGDTGETRVWRLFQEDPLEEEMATHSSILAWKISWTEEPSGLQSMGSQSQTWLSTHTEVILSLWQMRILRFTWTDFLGIQYLLRSKPILESRKLLWLDSLSFRAWPLSWNELPCSLVTSPLYSSVELLYPLLTLSAILHFVFMPATFLAQEKGTVSFSSFL